MEAFMKRRREDWMGKQQKKLEATSIHFKDILAISLTFIVSWDAGTCIYRQTLPMNTLH